MEDMMEQFGTGFLYIVSGITMLTMLAVFFGTKGVVYEAICRYLQGICG